MARHKHAEAYRLMRYRTDSDHEVVIWNSRDGAAPFRTTLPNGESARHVAWQDDRYLPDHRPAVGDLVFVDLTPRRAAEIAARNASRYWSQWMDSREQHGSLAVLQSSLERAYAEEHYGEHYGSEVVVVTDQMLIENGWS